MLQVIPLTPEQSTSSIWRRRGAVPRLYASLIDSIILNKSISK